MHRPFYVLQPSQKVLALLFTPHPFQFLHALRLKSVLYNAEWKESEKGEWGRWGG